MAFQALPDTDDNPLHRLIGLVGDGVGCPRAVSQPIWAESLIAAPPLEEPWLGTLQVTTNAGRILTLKTPTDGFSALGKQVARLASPP